MFQSTPPYEGRPDPAYIIYKYDGFNPRPRTRGDGEWLRRRSLFLCFNPRPRTRGDEPCQVMTMAIIVSIHAPVRGATLLSFKSNKINCVSIHAPVRGATVHHLTNDNYILMGTFLRTQCFFHHKNLVVKELSQKVFMCPRITQMRTFRENPASLRFATFLHNEWTLLVKRRFRSDMDYPGLVIRT
jgi:hypothetical protein